MQIGTNLINSLTARGAKMTVQQIYSEYDELEKPYQGNATVTPDELHAIVLEKLKTIHWNKLNEIESKLKNWYIF